MERRDLFGRTEAELCAAIARAERIYSISAAWTGKELLAINLAAKRANIEVDRRLLAIMRGEIPGDRPPFPEAARSKLYRELLSRKPHLFR